ncbi:MAG: hypothetical protein R3F49_08780 [Planctomycetota bacterium]
MYQTGAGSGGVNRGRGDAALSLGPETPHRSDAFQARRLDPGKALDLQQLQLLGVGSTAPIASEQGEATGLQRLGPDAGNAAWRRRLAPRHRHAVRTFFGDE